MLRCATVLFLLAGLSFGTVITASAASADQGWSAGAARPDDQGWS
ncbi:hypothetical protein [Streptomyces sp. NPDC051561]